MYEIEIQYFKKSGKYYTSGMYKTDKEWMWQIADEIKELKENNKLPGIEGNNWIIYICESNHPNGYPILIV